MSARASSRLYSFLPSFLRSCLCSFLYPAHVNPLACSSLVGRTPSVFSANTPFYVYPLPPSPFPLLLCKRLVFPLPPIRGMLSPLVHPNRTDGGDTFSPSHIRPYLLTKSLLLARKRMNRLLHGSRSGLKNSGSRAICTYTNVCGPHGRFQSSGTLYKHRRGVTKSRGHCSVTVGHKARRYRQGRNFLLVVGVGQGLV